MPPTVANCFPPSRTTSRLEPRKVGNTLNLLVIMFIMGGKKRAPDPNPAMTSPLARPFLSGNQSIRAFKSIT